MKKLAEVGDVLKTQPIPGFWTASVVLAVQAKTEDFVPMCLVGGTLCVFPHDFTFSEIVPGSLRLARGISGVYADRPMLWVHAARLKLGVDVIGRVNVDTVADRIFELRFSRQDMPEWAMSGSLSGSIGSSSVHAWRSAHDRERWLQDLDAAARSHEAMITRLKEEARSKRQARKRPN